MTSYANCREVSAVCPVSAAGYGYTSSLPANATLLAISSLIAISQVIQGVAWKTWGFMAAFVLGSLCEVAGYAGRLIMHSNPWSYHGFVLQLCCLTVGPIFYSAGIYLAYSRLVETYNTSLSRINLEIYPLITATCNILPFVLQMTGAVILSNEVYKDEVSTRGTNLMIAGLAFQIFTLILFGILSVEYAIRAYGSTATTEKQSFEIRRTKRFRFFPAAISFAYILVMIRCIYQATALAGGHGAIIQNEGEFIALDGALVVAAGYALSLVHPGYVFQRLPQIDEKNFAVLDED